MCARDFVLRFLSLPLLARMTISLCQFPVGLAFLAKWNVSPISLLTAMN